MEDHFQCPMLHCSGLLRDVNKFQKKLVSFIGCTCLLDPDHVLTTSPYTIGALLSQPYLFTCGGVEYLALKLRPFCHSLKETFFGELTFAATCCMAPAGRAECSQTCRLGLAELTRAMSGSAIGQAMFGHPMQMFISELFLAEMKTAEAACTRAGVTSATHRTSKSEAPRASRTSPLKKVCSAASRKNPGNSHAPPLANPLGYEKPDNDNNNSNDNNSTEQHQTSATPNSNNRINININKISGMIPIAKTRQTDTMTMTKQTTTTIATKTTDWTNKQNIDNHPRDNTIHNNDNKVQRTMTT